jgi:hypothetical protein
MKYEIPELKLRFPFSYGDTLFSIFVGKGQYCHRIAINIRGYTRVLADAEGDLVLPNNEKIKKALRIHTLRHYIETGKDSVEMTLDSYAWYANQIRYPVFESMCTSLSKKGDRKDYNGESMNDTVVFNTSFYYPPEIQTYQFYDEPILKNEDNYSNEILKIFTESSFMPNPVTEYLQIKYYLTRPAEVWFTLHNNWGMLLTQITPKRQVEGYQFQKINMSSFVIGSYTLYIHVDDMEMKQIIIKK